MLLIELITWWYTGGLITRLRTLGSALQRTQDTFSVGLALRTFFRPFRQIDANHNTTITRSIDQQFRNFIDTLVSRFIGALMRFFVIIAGLLTLFAQVVFSAAVVAVHVLVPLLPFIGAYLTLTGMVPPDVQF